MTDELKSMIWIYADSGSGKTTLSMSLGVFDTVVATDFFYIDNQEVIPRVAPDLELCWDHSRDICHEDRIIGNLGIAGFWMTVDARGLTDRAIDLFFELSVQDDDIVWIEGWVTKNLYDKIVDRFVERGYRTWRMSPT